MAANRLFFRFDPLLFLLLSLAGRMVLVVGLWSLLILAGTVLFGRWFCGFVCPLGTLIDLGAPLLEHKHKKEPDPVWKKGKYLLLLFLVGAAALGLSFGQLLDPLTIVDRTLALVIYPAASYLLALVTPVLAAGFTEGLITLAALALILGLGWWQTRFWCRNLCPLGGLLAAAVKFSVFKFAVRGQCDHCGFCSRVCPAAAIDPKTLTIDTAECIVCLRCWSECPKGQIGYGVHRSGPALDIKRRHALAALAAGAVIAPLVRFGSSRSANGRLIRPPGAWPETEFTNTCLRCGLCMKVCPTNGLQPSISEAGLAGLWTPRLVGRIGGCEKNCNACGQTCPTGAIRRLSMEEKSFVKMGTAVIDRSRCIAWEQDKICLICDEACPYNAIESRIDRMSASDLLRPFVDENLCVGCGICETRCPIEGSAAIQMYSIGEERRRTGSYITVDKIRRRAQRGTAEDLPSGFITE